MHGSKDHAVSGDRARRKPDVRVRQLYAKGRKALIQESMFKSQLHVRNEMKMSMVSLEGVRE